MNLLSGCFNLGLGISVLLNLVKSNIRQILILTISLLLFGLLSGCVNDGALVVDPYELVGIALGPAIEAGVNKPRDPYSHRTGKNHYEPEILASNKEMIRIKYLSVGPNAEHEQVTQLIRDHCDGAYIETSRVELRGYDTVEAECTHEPVSLQ